MKTTQTWKIGDCLQLLPEIPDKSIDMILTDLPYGTTACSWDVIIPFDLLWEQWYRILRPNGFIVLTASQPFTTKMIASNIDNFSHQWIWEKEQGSNPLLANIMPMKDFEDVIVFSNEYKADMELKHPLRGYFKKVLEFIGLSLNQINKIFQHRRAEHSFYINSTQFELCTKETYLELTVAFKLDTMDGYINYNILAQIDLEFVNRYKRIYNPQKTKGSIYKSGGGYIAHLDNNVVGGNVSSERFPSSIINFNTKKSSAVHPTQKPLALFEYLIRTYTNEGDTVHDSCLGSGTTLESCANLNRNCIGFELLHDWEEHYRKRLKLDNTKLDAWTT